MIPARSLFPAIAGAVSLVGANPVAARETDPPPRPPSRIHDGGSVFQAGEGSRQIADEIRKRLDALQSETGCDVLIATVSTSTGTSPPLLADRFAASWLTPGRRGAVLVYERAGNRLAVSATGPVRDAVADYELVRIEQSLTGNRENSPPAQAVSLAAADLTGLFRKAFGEAAGRAHPAVKKDRILFGVVTGCIAALIAVAAALHWRREKGRG